MILWLNNKKGSHVGIIISFSLFVAFLIFLYTATQPVLESKEEQKNLMQELKNKITDRVSENFTTMTIINSSFNEDCIKIENYPYSDMDTIVKDSNGEKVPRDFSGDSLYIENTASDGFYKIYSSESSLDNSEMDHTGTCYGFTSDFKRGINRMEKKVSFQRMEGFIEEYNTNYSLVKEQLDVPEENGFALDFLHNNEPILETSKTNLTRSVFIEKKGVMYFDEDADMKGGFLRISVW